MSRPDPLLPNALIVARREYAERVRNRLFIVSTVLLATLAVLVAFVPLFIRVLDRDTINTITVVASDRALADRAVAVLDGVMNSSGGGSYRFELSEDAVAALTSVAEGRTDAALLAVREPSGRLAFGFHVGDRIGAERAQLVSVGTLAVAILDWTSLQSPGGGLPFQMPSLDVIAATGPGAGGQPITGAEFAGRRILGIVFVFVIFLTIVIYGMWVAAGVVAEKASRVMELMISAASPRQLVTGKVLGIGLAGLTQNAAILAPALIALSIQDAVAGAVLGAGPSIAPSLSALSPALLLGYTTFFIGGFTLYALIYAAAGSLISRTEDLQMLALPLSVVAIGGYLTAILALGGATSGIVRVASYLPFWSPFVMPTRLTVGRVEGWEVVLALVLLMVTIAAVFVIAIRVYAAGVLLYGQKPGVRAVVRAAVGAR